MPYELKPWNAELYAKDMALFLGEIQPGLSEPVVTVEYIKALNDIMHAGQFARNMSLNGIDHMTADVASYAHYGDFREFAPGQAWIAEAQHVVSEIIGSNPHHIWV